VEMQKPNAKARQLLESEQMGLERQLNDLNKPTLTQDSLERHYLQKSTSLRQMPSQNPPKLDLQRLQSE